MKKILLIISALGFLYSCASDNYEEYYLDENDFCATANISFSNDVQPVIDANCAVAGCHVPGNGIPVWDSYETISAYADRIAERTLNGEMPPAFSGYSLSLDEIQEIQCWVESGAPNN